jgi:hypothetical protein
MGREMFFFEKKNQKTFALSHLLATRYGHRRAQRMS